MSNNHIETKEQYEDYFIHSNIQNMQLKQRIKCAFCVVFLTFII